MSDSLSRDLPVSARISGLGFLPDHESGGFRRGGLAFNVSGGWCELQRRESPNGDRLRSDHLGRPGLWRRLGNSPPGRSPASACTAGDSGAKSIVEEVFESPANLLIPSRADDLNGGADEDHLENGAGGHGLESDAGDADVLSLWLAWALATKDGDAPAGWRCPSRPEIEAWIGPGEPLARSGAIIRQGAVVRGENRLALRLPILPVVRTPLPEHRAAWLDALLEDAAERWRMVRIGMPGDAASPLALAEIDFTGAPPALLPDLVRTGVQVLRLVVEWLALPAAFLANGRLPCRALEVCLPRV